MTSRREVIRRLGRGAVGAVLPLAAPRWQAIAPFSCTGVPDVPGFASMCFTDSKDVSHQVYVAGTAGPPVLLLHEIPGLTGKTFETARALARASYVVLVPLLFGRPFDDRTVHNIWSVCGRDEFDCNAGTRTSPHVAWLRELAARARATWTDGRGVGAIGMCLTGAFPLAMLRAPEIIAPVLCQPTLPFNRFNIFQPLGWFVDDEALAIHPGDLAYAKGRTSMPILGLRYQGDDKCRKDRFARLHREFPERFYRLDVPGTHHSTLVGDPCPAALAEVLSFLNQQLRTTPDAQTPAFPVLSRRSANEVTPEACRARHGQGHSPSSAS